MKKTNPVYDKFMSLLVVIMFLIITKFKCIIKSITGLPCPACGLTRSCISLLKLDFNAAWNYHPLYWFIPPVILFIFFAKKPLFNNRKKELCFFILVFAIILSVYIYRMINLFPNHKPMDYNSNSIFHDIYERIKFMFQSINL